MEPSPSGRLASSSLSAPSRCFAQYFDCLAAAPAASELEAEWRFASVPAASPGAAWYRSAASVSCAAACTASESPAAPHVQIQRAERSSRVLIEFRQAGNSPRWKQTNLVRPPGSFGHKCGPVVVAADDPGSGRRLPGEEFVEHVRPPGRGMRPGLAEHPPGARGDERGAVDLPGRLAERAADFLASVLEAVHLLHARHGRKDRGAVRPRPQDDAA